MHTIPAMVSYMNLLFSLSLLVYWDRHTTSQELYPMNEQDKNSAAAALSATNNKKQHKHGDSARFERLLQEEMLNALTAQEREEADRQLKLGEDSDASLWSTERVRKWLVQIGLEDLYCEY